MEQQLKEVEPLSHEAGIQCFNIGNAHGRGGRFSEAAGWFKQAVDAMEHTPGPAHSRSEKCRGKLEKAISRMEESDPKAAEYTQILVDSEGRTK
jgi:hypothetical protein